MKGPNFGENVLSFFLMIFGSLGLIKIVIDLTFKDMQKTKNGFIIIMSIFFFIFCFGFNVALTQNELVCDSTNTSLAIQATIFPFIFIYVLGFSLLFLFQGWMRSFENTFGLTVAQMCGFTTSTLVKNINSKSGNDAERLYSQFKENPTVLFNELLFDQNKEDIKNFDILRSFSIGDSDDDLKNMLKKYMTVKETTATMIWFLLLGMITLLVSQNTLLSNNCQKTVDNRNDFKNYVSSQLKE